MASAPRSLGGQLWADQRAAPAAFIVSIFVLRIACLRQDLARMLAERGRGWLGAIAAGEGVGRFGAHRILPSVGWSSAPEEAHVGEMRIGQQGRRSSCSGAAGMSSLSKISSHSAVALREARLAHPEVGGGVDACVAGLSKRGSVLTLGPADGVEEGGRRAVLVLGATVM